MESRPASFTVGFGRTAPRAWGRLAMGGRIVNAPARVRTWQAEMEPGAEAASLEGVVVCEWSRGRRGEEAVRRPGHGRARSWIASRLLFETPARCTGGHARFCSRAQRERRHRASLSQGARHLHVHRCGAKAIAHVRKESRSPRFFGPRLRGRANPNAFAYLRGRARQST